MPKFHKFGLYQETEFMPDYTTHFQSFRKNIVGNNLTFSSPYGEKNVLYADWIASGRLYQPIEDYVAKHLGPFVANTHTETSVTGQFMTDAYHQAQHIIKQHVNANNDDILISAGFGMTAVVNKFQRILGLRAHESHKAKVAPTGNDKPIVFITHMEHHSNQTSWLECLCDVEIIRSCQKGLPDLGHLRELLETYKDRPKKIGAFSACSNVTGLITPIHEMAELMHEFGGLCFADYAASAPYVKIDMHPENDAACIDAVMFSPHKFLGGPGASGILIFNKNLYACKIPDHPGGGTVLWTNPWGEHKYFENIETREDGGTPGFLQTIRASLVCLLKEEMGEEKIEAQEKMLIDAFCDELGENDGISILERHNLHRIGALSVVTKGKHYNLVVKLLNDLYGIQTRGGFSCAGTYGHLLFDIDKQTSNSITDKIELGDFSDKSGWIRISLHPTMTAEEARFIAASLKEVINTKYDECFPDYLYNPVNNEFTHKNAPDVKTNLRQTFRAS